MKTKLVTCVCALAVGLGGVIASPAEETARPEAIAVDVVVARPFCLAATVAGSAFFLLALPFAAFTKDGVKNTADTLVAKPAKATFTRPLGQFTALDD